MDALPIQRLLYYWRYLFSCLELYVTYYWRVMDPNMHRNHFAIRRFLRTYTRNSKTTGCMRTFYISKDCFTITDVYILLEPHSRYKWRVTPPNTHRSLFLISHFYTYTVFLDALFENFRSYVNVQHIARLLHYQRHCLFVLELY